MISENYVKEIEKELGIWSAQLPILRHLPRGVIAWRELNAMDPRKIENQRRIVLPALQRDLEGISIEHEGEENIPGDMKENPVMEVSNHTSTRISWGPIRERIIRKTDALTTIGVKPDYLQGKMAPLGWLFRSKGLLPVHNKAGLRGKIIEANYGRAEAKAFISTRGNEEGDYETLSRIIEGTSRGPLAGEGARFLGEHSDALREYEGILWRTLIEKVAQTIELGYGVHILGDGTRKGTNGKPNPRFGELKPGAIELAFEHGMRILPIGFSNAEAVYRRGFDPRAQNPPGGERAIIRYGEIIDDTIPREKYNRATSPTQRKRAVEEGRKMVARAINDLLEPTHKNLDLER